MNDDSDELSLHHDFELSRAKKNCEEVTLITNYIKTIGNLFDAGNELVNSETQQESPAGETSTF